MIIINSLLLILGTVGALTAFGGETWVKGTEPLRKRITGRGWLSILCLLSTLAIGVWKEALTQAAAEASRVEAKALTADAEKARALAERMREELIQIRADNVIIRRSNDDLSASLGQVAKRRIGHLRPAGSINGGYRYIVCDKNNVPLRIRGNEVLSYTFIPAGNGSNDVKFCRILAGLGVYRVFDVRDPSGKYRIDDGNGRFVVAGPNNRDTQLFVEADREDMYWMLSIIIEQIDSD